MRKPRAFRRLVIFGGLVALLLAAGYWYWIRLPANDYLIHALMSESLPSYIHTTQALGEPELQSNDKDADPGQVAEVVYPPRKPRDDETVTVRVFRSAAEASSSYEQYRLSDTRQSVVKGVRIRVTPIGLNNIGYCLGNGDTIFFCRALIGRAVASLIAPKGEPQTFGINAAQAVITYIDVSPQER